METLALADNGPYMSDHQLDYFKNKLILQKLELLEKIQQKKNKIKLMGTAQPDLLDKSNSITQINQDIQSYERSRDVVKQIDEALMRIEDGSFGYCKITGMKIGLKRLEAIPFASMSIKAIEEIELDSGPSYAHF